MTKQDHHNSAITALHFTEDMEISKETKQPVPQIDLISSGADKTIHIKRLNKELLEDDADAS